jgi:predicted RNase H-like nuclease (RuvC/YqgF family)
MFETLMLHIVQANAGNSDKFELGDLDDEKQDESKNFEETVKKYQSEIRALSRVNDEIKKYAAETAEKLELAVRRIAKEEELTRVVSGDPRASRSS